MKLKLKQDTKDNLKEFSEDIDKHEIFLLAASIAYTTALALAPFVLILLSLSSLMGKSLQQNFAAQISATVGDKAGEAINQVIQNAKEHPTLSGISGIIAFIVLVVSSSAIFSQLRVALDKVNEFKLPKDKSGIKAFIKDKVFSVGLVFGFAFLSIVSLVASTTIASVFSGGEGLLWKIATNAFNFLMFCAIFTAIYRFIPTDKQSWRTCVISGLVSSLFYLIGKSIISFYLAKASFESSYGAAGSLIAFLAWVYYSALTLLVSYEFSKTVVLHRNDMSRKDHKTMYAPL
jgi:membrane protein